MADYVNTQVTSLLNTCKYYSLALDESCDTTDTSQASVFVRCKVVNFILVKLLDSRQIISTKGEYIFEQIIMNIYKIYKYLHQAALCVKDRLIDPVVRRFDKILAGALNQGDEELLLHCSVHWLSKGRVLERFWKLRHNVLHFNHLNNFNLNLHGKNCLFPVLFSEESSFRAELLRCYSDFSQILLTHFSRMQESAGNFKFPLNFEKYKDIISVLENSFETIFPDFRIYIKNIYKKIELFTNPFSISKTTLLS
ncbi:hypothetical protein PR048_008586 [Dryococelus australis]|uniref:Uncharacterized protein n=1 Tax=Dryococelus australis TaxID=614101 RepID=A0ABQ9HXI0_9NEOP|nr:hypothetical protein PR048_008586 [Dryococelus australis]